MQFFLIPNVVVRSVTTEELTVRVETRMFAVTSEQLVEALRYKPEDHGFDPRWCHWDFSLT